MLQSFTTGDPDVQYDYNNISAVYKTVYENVSKITVNAMYRNLFE